MNKLAVMGVVAGVCAAAFAERQGPWPKEKAWAWHDAQPWYRGCNYMPASAANRVDQWQSHGAGARFAEMEREMALAEQCGFNAMRILILEQGFCVWLDEHDAFMANFERTLSVMAKHGVRAMVVLGNDCSRPKRVWRRPELGEQPYDVGYHGGRRQTQHGGFPGECGYLMVDDEEYRGKFLEMCRELISKYAHDPRVIVWNLWNEPGAGNRGEKSADVIRELFGLAWKIDPDQPLCADTWSRSISLLADGKDPHPIEKLAIELSDVVSYHGYCPLATQIKVVDALSAKYGRPLLNTEWLLRGHGCEFADNYAFFAQRRIAAFNWGFVNGKYQTHEPYEPMWKNTFEYASGRDPTKWFHDLFRPSHHPWDPYEIAVARNVNAEMDSERGGQSLRAKIAKRYRITGEDMWYGYRRTKFDFGGRAAWVVEPSVKPLEGRPWTWTMQWAEAYVDRTGVPDLLKKGFHHVTIDLFDTRMNAAGLETAAAFQDFLVKDLGLAPKADLVGMSWGGFFSVRYASTYPANVAKIYLDAPLMNFDNFPHIRDKVPESWLDKVPAGGWTASPEMPINRAEAVAKAGIPILLAYGGEDQTVPPKHNCEIFIPRFKAAGGKIEVIKRGLFGHHPHGFDPDKTGVLVDFFEAPLLGCGIEAQPYWTKAKYPAMTSPAVVCVKPGEKFSYAFTYAGRKPYEIRLKGIGFEPVPKGLSFDAKTGVLSGVPDWTGDKWLTFTMNEGEECVQWGDVKIRVYGAKKVPDSLFNECIYQLDVANFTKEGTLKAAEGELKRLADLGISWVYLCPVTEWDKGTDPTYHSRRQKASGFAAPRNPYRPADFMNVEPTLGTKDDFRRFVKSAHALGLKVMTDVVFFHCGPNAVFLKEHPDWVKRDEKGNFTLGEWAFPRLDFANAGLRRYLTDSLLMWLRDFDVDGFRCDVGSQVPRDFWEAARVEIDAAKKDVVMLLEGTEASYAEKAFDMFYGFIASHNGINETLNERMPASNVRRQWEKERALGPAGVAWMRCTDTHDVACDNGERREEKRWGRKRAECGLALMFALDGVPMLWMGQEIGWDRRYSIFGPTPIDWSAAPVPDRPALLRRLTALKREPAFGAKGEIVWLEPSDPDDELLFLRRAPDGTTYRCRFNLGSGDWAIEK